MAEHIVGVLLHICTELMCMNNRLSIVETSLPWFRLYKVIQTRGLDGPMLVGQLLYATISHAPSPALLARVKRTITNSSASKFSEATREFASPLAGTQHEGA